MKKEINVDGYVKGSGMAVAGHSKKVNTKEEAVTPSRPDRSSLLGLTLETESGEQVSVAPRGYVGGKTIVGASFAGLDLSEIQFSSCELRGCDFRGTKLDGAKFTSVKIIDSDFSEASFGGASMNAIDVVGGSFCDANLKDSKWESASFRYTKMRHLDLEDAVLRKVKLEGVDIRGANWKHTDCNVQELIGSTLPSDYDQYDFYEAIESMGLSEKQFEYFAVSGALEIRDDLSQERVTRDFDPETQHVPAWQVHNPQWLNN